MGFIKVFLVVCLSVFTFICQAEQKKDITSIVTKKEFLLYKDVGEFIDHSPKVTVMVAPEESDIAQYGQGVKKTLTGSDCDRDGVMDDNQKCNAVYFKLWLKYKK